MTLRILLVEDNPDDAELVLYALESAGLACEAKRVQRPESFREALLEEGPWDVILSDFALPRFDAHAALRILQESGLETPFIILSGTIGEHIAVEAMKAGAQDFFAKDNLTRLPAAIQREIAEAEVRRERRQALSELRRVEERHRLVVESIRDYAIVMLDPQGCVATWNRGAERLLAWSVDDIVGHPLAQFFAQEAREAREPEAMLAGALAHGSYRREGWCVRRDGSRFFAECHVERIVDGELLLGFSCIIHDTTAKKRLVDELRQAVRSRDEFLAVAAHELKTPLTAVQLVLESLQRTRRSRPETPLGEPQLAGRIDRLERQLDRLTDLVDRLLDVGRLGGAGGDARALRREPTDLGELASAVVERLKDDARLARSELRLHRPEAPLVGQWDRLAVELLLTNLLANAIKYGAGHPVDIVVEAVVDHASARLVVQDRGIGIEAQDQQRIFERFERAVPDRHYGGFGVGLWLVRQVALAHEGTVRVDSAPGQGARFTVELPLEVAAGEMGD